MNVVRLDCQLFIIPLLASCIYSRYLSFRPYLLSAFFSERCPGGDGLLPLSNSVDRSFPYLYYYFYSRYLYLPVYMHRVYLILRSPSSPSTIFTIGTMTSKSSSPQKHVVVLGAGMLFWYFEASIVRWHICIGVVGLSTALRLQEKGHQVTIVAEILPTDPKTIKYTSHWAASYKSSRAPSLE